MSAESSLTAVAVVRALLNELVASLAGLAVLSAKVAARAEGVTEGEYLDRIIRLWTDSPG